MFVKQRSLRQFIVKWRFVFLGPLKSFQAHSDGVKLLIHILQLNDLHSFSSLFILDKDKFLFFNVLGVSITFVHLFVQFVNFTLDEAVNEV